MVIWFLYFVWVVSWWLNDNLIYIIKRFCIEMSLKLRIKCWETIMKLKFNDEYCQVIYDIVYWKLSMNLFQIKFKYIFLVPIFKDPLSVLYCQKRWELKLQLVQNNNPKKKKTNSRSYNKVVKNHNKKIKKNHMIFNWSKKKKLVFITTKQKEK